MTAVATIGELTAVLDRRHPLDLAGPADRVGLLTGCAEHPARLVLLAGEADAATVTAAVRDGAGMLVTHHSPDAPALAAAERAGLALYVAGGNAAAARGGTSDALAALLGLTRCTPLVAVPRRRDVLVVFTPEAHVSRIVDAVSAAGAGVIGDYHRCAWWTPGTGTYVPGAQAHPTVGAPGTTTVAPETRIEMLLPRSRRDEVVAAVWSAHPYEQPAYHLLELPDIADGQGHGRIGVLEQPVGLRELVGRLGGVTSTVRVAGTGNRPIRTVAVCAGTGAPLTRTAIGCGADAYVSGDLVGEDGSTVLIDAGSGATVRPWLDSLAHHLRTALPGPVAVRVTPARTGRWRTITTTGDQRDLPRRG